MNKLLKTVRLNNNRDEIIKRSIIDQLSNSVKELQYSGVEESRSSNVTDSTEAANQLCIIIEAIFLHGLKDSLTHRFRKALADVDARPEPNFWAPLLVISHRQIIDQITNLSQITTEIGQCRAWIRQALNDCLLSSYLVTMRQDSSALKNFYKVGALVRDGEVLDIAQRLIEGFEGFKSITLPCNSSLLNTWPPSSLYLAGIWAPTLKTCPVAPCDDIVQSIEVMTVQKAQDNISDTNSLSSAMSITSQSSGFRQMMAFNEDEVLKMILSKTDENYSNSAPDENKKSGYFPEAKTESTEIQKVHYNVGNSLNRAPGWSFDENLDNEENADASNASPKLEKAKTSTEPKSEDSFDALIDSYNVLHGDYIRTPNLKEVWQKIEDMHVNVIVGEPPSVNNNGNLVEEPVPNIAALKHESKALAVQLGEVCKEKGLDNQNFECLGCRAPFVADQKLNVCAFTGDYYCDNCMSDKNITIPARIIHNWDFNPYPVSQKSINYINEIKDHPVIDFKVLNPFIYSVVEEMAELQVLRNQLNYLRAYLYTCREPIIGELQKLMYPREYMYEHVHRYSVSDLSDIANGTLAQCLQQGVDFGKEHVTTCWLCSQKGFVCEICDKPKTIFPFDVANVYRCNDCNAVYHKHCLPKHKPCPKCKRRKEREDLSLLGATVEI